MKNNFKTYMTNIYKQFLKPNMISNKFCLFSTTNKSQTNIRNNLVINNEKINIITNKEIRVENLKVVNEKVNISELINKENKKHSNIFLTLNSIGTKEVKELPSIIPNTNSTFSRKNFYLQSNPQIIVKKNTTKEEFDRKQRLGGEPTECGEVLNSLDTDFEQKLKYSQHKLNVSLKKITGLFFDDAIQILEDDNTKGGIWLRKKLKIYKKENPNLFETNDFKLKIKTATVGVQRGSGRVNYRAKGRVDMIFSKLSSFRILFEKVKKEEICKELAVGNAPNFLKFALRKRLYSSNSALAEIQALKFLTSSRGGYDRKRVVKEMISRLTYEYFKKNKIRLNKSIVERKVLKSLTAQMIPIYDKYLSVELKQENSNEEVDEKEKKQKMIEQRHELYTKNLSLNTKKKK